MRTNHDEAMLDFDCPVHDQLGQRRPAMLTTGVDSAASTPLVPYHKVLQGGDATNATAPVPMNLITSPASTLANFVFTPIKTFRS